MKMPRVLQNTAIYTVIMFLQKGISFLLLPLYTYYLSPADYGVLGVVMSIASFLTVLISLGLEGAAARFYYIFKDNQEYHRKLYGTTTIIILSNALLWGCLFVFGHKLIIDPLIGTIDFYPYVFVGILTVMFTPLYTIFQRYLQTIQDGIRYGINNIVFFLLNVITIVVLLVWFHLGVLGVLLANLIVNILFFIYVGFVFIPKLILKIDKRIARKSLKYSLPLLPHMLANWSNGTIDKLLVNGIRSQADAGLYNLGQQYASVMTSMANGVNEAYVPWFYDMANIGQVGYVRIKKVANTIVWVLASFALVFAVFSKEVLGIMIHNPAFSFVWEIVPLVVFAYVFQSIYFLYVNVLFLKDTPYVFSITITSVIVNLFLNLVLIPVYGFVGCALACFGTYFIKSLIALVVSKIRNKDIRFCDISMYMAAFIGFVLSLSSNLLGETDLLIRLTCKSIICVSFVLFVGFRFKNEILIMSKKWQK